MKRVCDSDFARQNSGTMNYLPMPAANARRPFTAYSARLSSTVSIRNSICATSWSVSPITPVNRIHEFLPWNSWPQSCQRISQHLKCPPKVAGHLRPPCLNQAIHQDGLETALTEFLPLFQMFDSEINGFVATQTAGKQQRKKCTVSACP